MNQIPVLGGLVEAVTFRDYKYDNGKHTADIETPKLSVKKSKTDQEDSKTQQNLKETTKGSKCRNSKTYRSDRNGV